MCVSGGVGEREVLVYPHQLMQHTIIHVHVGGLHGCECVNSYPRSSLTHIYTSPTSTLQSADIGER